MEIGKPSTRVHQSELEAPPLPGIYNKNQERMQVYLRRIDNLGTPMKRMIQAGNYGEQK